jgi:hypothetical protein
MRPPSLRTRADLNDPSIPILHEDYRKAHLDVRPFLRSLFASVSVKMSAERLPDGPEDSGG